jgi:isopentenyl-diphosphate delta-isomerase
MLINKRKDQHVKICLKENVSSFDINTSFDNYKFMHNALPEINFDEIDLSTTFLNKRVNAPVFISSITGGYKEAEIINTNLAKAANNLNIAMGVGSMKIAIEQPETLSSFQVRKHAPQIPLLSNLGAVQLNYGYGIKQCIQVIESVKADVLILHLNPLQEAIQPEGDTNFKNLFKKIKQLKKDLPYPLIVKEVGSGISKSVAYKLKKIKPDYIDTAGTGGTSFAAIEGIRANNLTGETFRNWGIPTSESLVMCKKAGLKSIASGGIRTGIDAAKAIAMGASMVGIALPLLQPATESAEKIEEILTEIINELKIAMFCLGVKNIDQLKKIKLYK